MQAALVRRTDCKSGGGLPASPFFSSISNLCCDFLPIDFLGQELTLVADRKVLGHEGLADSAVYGEEVRSLTEIKLKKGESVDKALRRLKKKIDREGTLKTVRNHRHFEKPSERRRRKEKAARFSAMLTARYADM